MNRLEHRFAKLYDDIIEHEGDITFAVENGMVEDVQRLLKNPKCNVNAICTHDISPYDTYHVTLLLYSAMRVTSYPAGYLPILDAILKHPKRRVNERRREDGKTPLHLVCSGPHPSPTATRMLLKQKDINASLQDNFGLDPLSELISKVSSKNISVSVAILEEFVNYFKTRNWKPKVDRFGFSALDRFLCNTKIHSYELEMPKTFTQFLRLLLTMQDMINLSGRTLALAGTLCSPSVFDLLLEYGANVNDSLDGETSAHCVIARNSLQKCTSLLNKHPNLTLTWNYLSAVDLARVYKTKPEIMELLPPYSKVSLRDTQVLNRNKDYKSGQCKTPSEYHLERE